MYRFQGNTNEDDELETTNVYTVVNCVPSQAISLNDLNRIITYPLIDKLIKRIISGKWSDCSQQKRSFQVAGVFVSVENDIAYNSTRPVIPPRLCYRKST